MGSADSKLQIKKKIFRLADPGILNSNDPVWDVFWTVAIYAEDVFNLLTTNDIKTIHSKNPANFYMLVHILVTRFIYLSGGEKLQEESKKELLNCCRVLTRVIPFFFEAKKNVNELFWNGCNDKFQVNSVSCFNDAGSESSLSKLPTAQANTENTTRQESTGSTKPNTSDEPKLLPLGVQLINQCVALLFVPGFTIENEAIWEPGIGRNGKLEISDSMHVANRLELLRLLIVLCSECLYCTPQNLVNQGSRFMTVLVTSIPKVTMLSLICSLINTSCRGCREDSDELKCLMSTYSIELLALLFCYPIPQDDFGLLNALNIARPVNLVRYNLSKLHKKSELNYIVDNLFNYLKSPMLKLMGSSFPLLQDKMESMPLWVTEIIVLIWEFLQSNNAFRVYITTTRNKVTNEFYSNELVVTLLYYSVKYSNNSELKNSIRIINYFILFLTSNQLIVENLLLPILANYYNNEIPSHFTNSANAVTYRDLMVYHTCRLLIYNPKFSSDLLTPTYIEWLYNIVPVTVPNKPYITSENIAQNQDLINPEGGLCYNACAMLTQLTIKLSSSAVLMENSMNPDLLSLVLRAICFALINSPVASRTLFFVVVRNSIIYENIVDTIMNLSENEAVQLQVNELGKALRPKPPAGMSEHAKGKLPLDAPLAKTWSGLDASGTIVKLIELIRKEIPNFDSYTSSDTVILLSAIEKIPDINNKTLLLAPSNHVSTTPLKFIWSRVSLGWYQSVLWGRIFNNELYIHHSFLSKTSFSSSFGLNTIMASDTQGSGILSKWTGGWGITRSPKSVDPEYLKKVLFAGNFFNKTNISLFNIRRVGDSTPTLLLPKGAVDAVADNLVRRFQQFTFSNEQDQLPRSQPPAHQ